MRKAEFFAARLRLCTILVIDATYPHAHVTTPAVPRSFDSTSIQDDFC
jgi:hypothetical protein